MHIATSFLPSADVSGSSVLLGHQVLLVFMGTIQFERRRMTGADKCEQICREGGGESTSWRAIFGILHTGLTLRSRFQYAGQCFQYHQYEQYYDRSRT